MRNKKELFQNTNEQVQKKDWNDFRATGLLLVVNNILHVFGWALVMEFESQYDTETDKWKSVCVAAWPARVKYRGFRNKDIVRSHKKIAAYLKENINDIYTEAHE